jgi:HSP20 family molecular chaperone IbpA
MSTESTFQKQPSQTPDGVERTAPGTVFAPRVDIAETDDRIVVLADLPGVDEQSVDITLEKNVLTLRGTVNPTPYAGYALAYSEYEVGNFERVFTISDEVDREGIQASVRNGVLQLVLPKSKRAQAQKIKVTAAAE